MKLTIRGYDVLITASAENTDTTVATVVMLDIIAAACGRAAMTSKEEYPVFTKIWDIMESDIRKALSDAGMYE